MMVTSCILGTSLLPIAPILFSFYDQTNMWLTSQDHVLQLGVMFSWTRVQLPHMIC